MKKFVASVDPIFGIPLTEDQAFQKDKAIKTLNNLQDQIADHIVLLFTATEISGWEIELNAWRSQLVRRNRGKEGRQNLSKEDLVLAHSNLKTIGNLLLGKSTSLRECGLKKTALKIMTSKSLSPVSSQAF